MELDQIRYFVTIAKFLHFTRAAEHCNVSQPALTRAIQNLEQELGGPLLHRERRLTHLTELGKIILPSLEAILAAVEVTRALTRDYVRHDIAPLIVGCAPPIPATLLIGLLGQICPAVPGLQIEFVEAAGEQLVSMLLNGTVNAAIVSAPETLPQRIDRWPLFEQRYVVLAPPSHPLTRFSSVPWGALKNLVWLERADSNLTEQLWLKCFGPSERPKIAHRARQDSDLQHMVAAGLGVLLAPMDAPRLPSLSAIPLKDDPLRHNVELIVVAGRRFSPALQVFIKGVRLGNWPAYVGCPAQWALRPPAAARAGNGVVQEIIRKRPVWDVAIKRPPLSDRRLRQRAPERN